MGNVLHTHLNAHAAAASRPHLPGGELPAKADLRVSGFGVGDSGY